MRLHATVTLASVWSSHETRARLHAPTSRTHQRERECSERTCNEITMKEIDRRRGLINIITTYSYQPTTRLLVLLSGLVGFRSNVGDRADFFERIGKILPHEMAGRGTEEDVGPVVGVAGGPCSARACLPVFSPAWLRLQNQKYEARRRQNDKISCSVAFVLQWRLDSSGCARSSSCGATAAHARAEHGQDASKKRWDTAAHYSKGQGLDAEEVLIAQRRWPRSNCPVGRRWGSSSDSTGAGQLAEGRDCRQGWRGAGGIRRARASGSRRPE